MTTGLVLRPKESYLIPQELKNIYMNTFLKGLTEDEAIVAYRLAKRKNLDIEARQIFFVPYTDKQGRRTVVNQTSIDGFRLIASKTGKYGGSVTPKLTIKTRSGEKMVIPHEEYDPSETDHIISGTISVINIDFPQPQTATALYDSYCKKYNGNPSGLWATMPDVMILKCAEALALRKAFPQDLSGIYTSDEMDQAKNDNSLQDVATITVEATKPKASLKEFKAKKPEVKVEEAEVVIEETPIEVQPEVKEEKPKKSKPQTVKELIDFLPDGLRKMNPDIDPDVFDACRVAILQHFKCERVEDIPEDKLEEVRSFMRSDMLEMLRDYGYIE